MAGTSPHKAPVHKAAEPRYGRSFDPWNSVALGHQRAETKAQQGWRENRNWKLHSQFRAGSTGGKRLSDDFDEQHKVLSPQEMRARTVTNVVDMLRKPGAMRESLAAAAAVATATTTTSGSERETVSSTKEGAGLLLLSAEEALMAQREAEDEAREAEREKPRKMFEGLVIYVNGSTHPLISDHKLKHLLAENGARMSIHLGRRQVTHVILGRPAGASGGAGGGLAGGKLEKEIRRVGGCGIKYVGVEWVLESLKVGRRLPEARFSNVSVAPKGQKSVLGAFARRRHESGEASSGPATGE